MKLYCISGLGADERAFMNFKPEGVELVYIPWLEHDPGETLPEYALKLFSQVDVEDDYNLLGLSFGGMLASEIAKIRPPRHLFLVSTITSARELRFSFRVLALLGLHRIIPARWFIWRNPLLYIMLGAKKKHHKRMVDLLSQDVDPKYIKWAVGAIVNWKPAEKPEGIRIHGTNDMLLPFRGKVDHRIDRGTHFMIITRGREIGRIVRKYLF